jgi:ATP-binding cassette subfamily A (ABC1) protein 3
MFSKTTTINMLTGMISPTSGDALIFGSSIRENMTAVRKILGVCPQHNILFDLLTVKEHLELFAAIKGVPSEETDAAVQEMIAQVGLTEKVNDKSAALSGGMQRKLSVGIALLGDSKIIFLDEPTSGQFYYTVLLFEHVTQTLNMYSYSLIHICLIFCPLSL